MTASLLPDDYIADVHTRLVVYKRIAGMETKEDLKELQVELIDRFGLLPLPAKNLFRITELKQVAAPMGVRKFEIGSEAGRILFGSEPDIDTGRLVDLIQRKPDRFRFEGGNTLRLYGDFFAEEERFSIVSDMLELLSGQDNQLQN